jgi:hypothetical protein
MRQISDTRLARVARTTAPRDLTPLRHRALLRARAAVSALLRQCSERPHPGRALAGALALGEAAAAELAAIPDGADLRRRDEAGLARDSPGVAEAFAAAVQGIVRQYREGREIDPVNASPAELLGACLADAAPRTAQQAPLVVREAMPPRR